MLAAALLALVLLGRAGAGPPEGMSGKMVFDQAADGLQKYRKETETERRIGRLLLLHKVDDVRVAVALGEALSEPELYPYAACLLVKYGARYDARGWWKENEAGLRRRAAQLPR
jgi:hypothetical protein